MNDKKGIKILVEIGQGAPKKVILDDELRKILKESLPTTKKELYESLVSEIEIYDTTTPEPHLITESIAKPNKPMSKTERMLRSAKLRKEINSKKTKKKGKKRK